MPLWGKKSGTFLEEKKPTWQKDRDPTGSKDRVESNEEQNTFAANTGWVRRVNKAGRTIEEVLVAMSSKTGEGATSGTGESLPFVLGAANTTSIRFANADSLTTGDPLVVSVSYNEPVYVVGSPTIAVANTTLSTVTLTRASSGANGVNRIEFATTSGALTTGTGQMGLLGVSSVITLAGGNIFDKNTYDSGGSVVVAGLTFSHLTAAGEPYLTDNIGANTSIS